MTSHPPVRTHADVEALLADMTLAEKIGQMTQVEKNSLTPDDVTRCFIGSVLSGGGAAPIPNTPRAWHAMVAGFQDAALKTRLGVPLIYGVDAVHGHNNVAGAVIFPHNIGLGAARDAGLVERIGRATAEEVAGTGIHWNFAPMVAVPQDIRWGRTYECFGEATALVSELGSAYLRGLQGGAAAGRQASAEAVLGCIKHYLGDGGAAWGSVARMPAPKTALWDDPERVIGIDQGVTDCDEATLRAVHLLPYAAAIAAGARSIMVSYSSWGGLKMHAQRYLLTDVLKGELGFSGFLISDYKAVDQIDPDYDTSVVRSINAGLDMVMVPFEYERFIATLTEAVRRGDVAVERINDAVRRILRVKLDCGLFQQPLAPVELAEGVGSAAHRAFAREAVQKSLVLLQNEAGALPLAKDLSDLLIAGLGADDIGLQCGGWTIEWQGVAGPITAGTTLKQALQAAVSPATRVRYSADGVFDQNTPAEAAVVVLGEPPYAEGVGDRANLNLPPGDVALIERVRPLCRKLVLVLYSGRPLIITPVLALCDAVIAAWLPGTEGQGLADVLLGDAPFTGTLPHAWPRGMAQVPRSTLLASAEPPLFPYGFGLTA